MERLFQNVPSHSYYKRTKAISIGGVLGFGSCTHPRGTHRGQIRNNGISTIHSNGCISITNVRL